MSLDGTTITNNIRGQQTRRSLCAMDIAVVLNALLFSGCASSPASQSIGASYVSSIPYDSWSCSQLNQEQSALDAALANASTQQEQTRSDERVRSVVSMLIPIPPDTGSTNITSQIEIAHLKGEQGAVRQALAYNSCPTGDLKEASVKSD